MEVKKLRSSPRRKSMDTCGDPYMLQDVRYDTAVCTGCRAVYQSKRWRMDDDMYNEISEGKDTKRLFCPACRKIKDNFPGGVVTLKGQFLHEHKDEIMNLIRNEEEKAVGFNPLERIIGINNIVDGMELTTTNEKLAQRIGKSLRKAYQGCVGYKWSQDTKLLRVEWRR